MKIKLAYVLSHIQKALAFEWIAKSLPSERFEIYFILLNPQASPLEEFLIRNNIPVLRINYRNKRDALSALWQLYRFFRNHHIEMIHCHLFDASLIGLLAAKLAGVKHRIHTRHHASMHHRYFPRAVYYDRFINYLSTHIIAISENVRYILIKKEGVKPQKVQLVHHGFQLESFQKVSPERTQALREKYQIPDDAYPIIGIIARQTHLKGIQFALPAYEKFLEEYPQSFLILANAQGDYKGEIDKFLEKIPSQNYQEILFEEDLFALYDLLDIHVHTPIDEHCEAFGQTYVEALAAGVPSIFTSSGVAREFIKHKQNAWIVPFEQSEAIYEALAVITKDAKLREQLIQKGQEDVYKLFPLTGMMEKLIHLYENNHKSPV